MILPGRLREEREDFFSRIHNRITGVALEKDNVIPYHGVREALGNETTEATISLLDFPFPLQTKDQRSLNNAFTGIFSRVVSFFA